MAPYLFDLNLATAVVYLFISCLYLRPHHGLGSRLLLALAALSLAMLAACKSDSMHNIKLPVIEPPPIIYGWPGVAPMAGIGARRVADSV